LFECSRKRRGAWHSEFDQSVDKARDAKDFPIAVVFRLFPIARKEFKSGDVAKAMEVVTD
jgi:hypothetical protein